MNRVDIYRGRHFPPAIISHAVWLYCRFTLSFTDVEELLAYRSIQVCYETIRRWCIRCGPIYAQGLRRQTPRQGDVVGIDLVEVAPDYGPTGNMAFLAAQLRMNVLGCSFREQGKSA